ncbi:MAG: hypothetical protein GY869_13760 [Planctomycetes bacterium]|nr:hypothetical protein [Planctomycetota bacterium]
MSRKKKKKKSTRKKQPLGFWEKVTGGEQPEWWEGFKRQLFYGVLVGVWLTVAVLGLNYLEHYVKALPQYNEVSLSVELLDPPNWTSEDLIDEVCLSAGLRMDDVLLDEELTDRLMANLLDQNKSPWIKHVRQVRKQYDGKVIIDCELRRPIAMIHQGTRVCYIDAEGVVLPAAPLEGRDNHIVRVQGIDTKLPREGEPVNSEPLMDGIEVLALIRGTDEKLKREERLWHELAVIDVSNWEGQDNPANPHLMLYTHNNTEIRWGAAVGRSQPYYEATYDAKLSMLYRNHRLQKSLDVYEYVDLRNRRQERTNPFRDKGKRGINGN